MATDNSTIDSPVIFQSAWGVCLHLPRPADRRTERYTLLTSDGQRLGDIRWQGTQQRYVLLPFQDTVWGSTSLTQSALWLRRLTRQTLIPVTPVLDSRSSCALPARLPRDR